ncbi:uncharacterized protein FTJAE_5053 [Fusarium tjaetaba]|uniref:Uncharacterized protein n=1 Tax=Fusarium tjaetaba TaxID=1567544 RepID=A0A8H5RST0_9HYPO|nr:uncharacterized protein FTJAE_5053 [Fusarium tjaetaba]KAF5638982.1 hypothetical protein FTJAE_5053 [Fusarium tjaetaba]
MRAAPCPAGGHEITYKPTKYATTRASAHVEDVAVRKRAEVCDARPASTRAKRLCIRDERPIDAYKGIAMMDAVYHTIEASYSKTLCKPIGAVAKLYTTTNSIENDVPTSTDVAAETDGGYNMEQRMPFPPCNFVDPYTTQYQWAGFKTLATMVALRTCMKAMEMTKDIVDSASEVEASSGNWILRIMECTIMVAELYIRRIVQTWRKMRDLEIPIR